MVFKYDPMDVDVLPHNENAFLSEDDEMDIVHEPIIKTTETDDIPVVSPFLQHEYKKSTEICNSVSSLFGKVCINDAKNEVSTSNATQNNQFVATQSPPLSPERQCLSINRTEYPTFEGPGTPVSLPSSPGRNTLSPDESALSTTAYSHTNHYNPANNYHATHNPTFVYHAAPPVDTSHGRVVFMFGIFKITCYSVVFFCCLYVGYHVVSNLHHDMISKIESYESDLLSDQMYCREQYNINRCGPDTRLPAVKGLCRSWEQCMIRPFSVGKTKVLAEVIGDTANGFSEVLSLRTMVTH
ncbi:hypothetical protein PS15m_009397 [Mucor circinelloides]